MISVKKIRKFFSVNSTLTREDFERLYHEARVKSAEKMCMNMFVVCSTCERQINEQRAIVDFATGNYACKDCIGKQRDPNGSVEDLIIFMKSNDKKYNEIAQAISTRYPDIEGDLRNFVYRVWKQYKN